MVCNMRSARPPPWFSWCTHPDYTNEAPRNPGDGSRLSWWLVGVVWHPALWRGRGTGAKWRAGGLPRDVAWLTRSNRAS